MPTIDEAAGGDSTPPTWSAQLIIDLTESGLPSDTPVYIYCVGHGGVYDHVPPPPFIGAGTTITPPAGFPVFDHASILKTVWDCFNIPDSLPYRDSAAPSLYQALSSTADNKTGVCNVKLSCDSEPE